MREDTPPSNQPLAGEENEQAVALEQGQDQEQKIEQKEEKESEVKDFGGTKRLNSDYGYKSYKLLLFFAYLTTIINGAILPIFGVLFREILEVLTSSSQIAEGALRVLVYFILMGVGLCVFTILQYATWGYYGSNITLIVRKKYFSLLLEQEIGFHDKNTSAKLNSELTSECTAIEDGIGIKTGFAIQQFASFIIGFIIAFIYSWQMTLVLIACMPVVIGIGVLQGKIFQGKAGQSADPFVKASAFTQEVLSNMRTVLSLPSLVSFKKNEYWEILEKATPPNVKRGAIVGLGIGLLMFGMIGVMYSIGLYYGSTLVQKNKISIGDMFGCFFCYLFAGMALGQVGSVTGDINKANIGANRFYALLDRKILLREPDADKKTYERTDNNQKKLSGYIEFQDVHFAYPVAPDTKILKGINFRIEAGKTLAIVGPSGSGKSTVIALLQRYYDPLSGNVMVDNELVHNYSLDYLRSNIGLVSQLPLLFDESIFNNIKGGRENITNDQIYEAAKFANAHDFVLKLPNGYETKVGEMGNRLSGGQKQRIAIARALAGSPSILLLDEATSALDSRSEREVQDALDHIASTSKHTIIVIAHRLSTIQKSDKIIVLVDGEVEEQGNHHELMDNNRVYATLVKQQQIVEAHKQRKSSFNVLKS